MTIVRILKTLIFKIVIFKPINKLLVFIERTIGSPLSRKLPVNSKFEISLPQNKTIKFVTRGEDSIINDLYYGGFDCYEPETMMIFLNLIKDCRTFVDIGANTGIFSLIAAKMEEGAKIYSFEPEINSYKYFSEYIELNNINNIYAENVAVSNSEGQLNFFIPESSSLPLGGSTRLDVHETVKKKKVTVNSVTLDSYFEKVNLYHLDLIKIDTEGTEHNVLEGAKKLLKSFEPAILCEVLPGLTEIYLHEILDGTNYLYFHIVKDGLIKRDKIVGDTTYEFKNYLFINREKLQNKLYKVKVLEF